MSDDNDGGGGGGFRTIVLLVLAVVAGIFAFKLTAWLLKSVFVLAALGVAGYVGYTVYKRLGSDDKPASKQLTHDPLETRSPSDEGEDPMADIEATLAELKRLKDERNA